MGAYRTDYIIHGWKLPYELKDSNGAINLWADKFLPYIEGQQGITHHLAFDSHEDGYVVFGRLLARSNDSGFEFDKIDLSKINAEETKELYRTLFGATGEVAEPYLFAYTQWS